MSTPSRPFPFRPSLSFALLLMLLACLWLMGGASRADASGQALVRAAAWAALALAALFGPRPSLRDVRPVFVFLLLALGLVCLQLIPLPPGMWQALPGRAILTEAAAGGAQPWRPWTITPGATMNAASSLVVPLAVLILLAGLKPAEQARLPGVLLALIAASMLVGLLQFSGARLNNPFVNDTVGQVSGTFANRNHFAVFLAIGCLVAPYWAFAGAQRARWRGPLALAFVILFTLTILASGSRAGMLTGVVAIVIGLVIVRRDARRQLARAPRWVFPALAAGIVGVIGTLVLVSIAANRAESVNRVFTADVGSDMRSRALPTVLDMIRTYFPAGSGLGGFDPMFRIHEPLSLLKFTYFNHAHNDFLEIVLDAGLPGLIIMIAALGWWAWKGVAVWRGEADLMRGPARLGSAVLLLLIMASVVDYPVRTPMMMAVAVIAVVWLSRTDDPRRSALPKSVQRL